jgi:uncharacterized membrane protein
MTDKELQNRIESSEALRRARETLLSEVSFRAGASARFDPFTILMIISIIVQVISACQKRRNPDKIINDIRNARALSPMRTRRLRKKLDAMWETQCQGNSEECAENILYAALVDVAERADDAEIQEIMDLAAQQK